MILNTDKTELFISKANKIHKNRYDYSKVNYINAKTKINIICREHGEFQQTPSNHLSKYNCQKCAKNYQLNTDSFIEKANQNGFSVIRLLQDDVYNDKFDWFNEIQLSISKIITTQKIHNIYICKNNEYMFHNF